jgi:hypothetical protein
MVRDGAPRVGDLPFTSHEQIAKVLPVSEYLFSLTGVYSPFPSGRGQGEGQEEPRRARVEPILPYAEVKTALG